MSDRVMYILYLNEHIIPCIEKRATKYIYLAYIQFNQQRRIFSALFKIT